jgi:CRISPR/Cas system CSM-associated protein Csm2 small subunit
MANVNTMQVINDAREELKSRVALREQTDKRIAELRIMLRALGRFANNEQLREEILREVETAKRRSPSLTDAVYDALMRNPGGLTSNQMREFLEQSAFDLEEYSQPLSAIMTALSRLVSSGHVKRRVAKDRGVIFRAADFDEEKK